MREKERAKKKIKRINSDKEENSITGINIKFDEVHTKQTRQIGAAEMQLAKTVLLG